MKQLMLYMRQLNQRRTSAFYLLPHSGDDNSSSREQLRLEHMAMAEDRPRSLREMFADVEYDSDEDNS